MRWGQSLPLALALLASRVVADSDVLIPRGPAPIPIDSAGGGAGIGPTTWAIAFVFAAAGSWLVWRSRKRSAGHAARGKLAVAETRSLGNRQYLVVASYGKQRFLLGVCVGRISLLAPLGEDADLPPS